MIKFILAGLLTGGSFSLAVASATNNLSLEGMSMGIISILLIMALSAIVYFVLPKRQPKGCSTKYTGR